MPVKTVTRFESIRSAALCSVSRRCGLAAALGFSVAAALAQPLPKDSPFLPPAAAAQSGHGGPTAYELVGVTTLGPTTLVGISRQKDKRSFWIPVGKTDGEITVVSYNPKNDETVIKAEGQTLTLGLRKASVSPGVAAAFAAAVPASSAPGGSPTDVAVSVPTRPLNAQEEKEMEARMLVTDLLEIGQQQRQAYAEAQRQAAARLKNPGSTAVTPPPAGAPKP